MSDERVWNVRHFDRYMREEGDILAEIEKDNVERDVPLIGPAVGKLLFVIARMLDARKVLELGTANGYSAIWLARAMGPEGRVRTLEYDADAAKIAEKNIEEAGLSDRIEIITGDAREFLADEEGPYDLIFIDIEKEMYSGSLEDCVRLLRPGGVLFADNVAFKTSGDFNDRLHAHPELDTSFVYGNFASHNPDEDAVSISVKRRA